MTNEEKDKLLEDVYSGESSIFDLPEWLFLLFFLDIWGEVEFGYGASGEILEAFRINVNEFAGAKTAQLTSELGNFIMVGGKKRTLEEFKDIAKGTLDKFDHWTSVEMDTARRRASAAKFWEKIQDEKEKFPYLKYVTVGDDRVRPSHAKLDGTIRRVDDPFWDTHFPPWEYNCRCTVQRLESVDGFFNAVNPVRENPAKSWEIFASKGKEKHPYFDYNSILRELSKNNFGFGYV